MSIINDALKKTQLKFKKKDKVPSKTPEPQPEQGTSNIYEKLYKARTDQQNSSTPGQGQRGKISEKTTPKPRSAKKWLAVAVIVIICLLCSYGSFFFLSRFPPFRNFFQTITKHSSYSRTRIVRRAPKKRKYKPGELVLNGTSLIDGKRVALINDEIYQIGETIDGKKIISINLNKIELSDDETIITLKVH